MEHRISPRRVRPLIAALMATLFTTVAVAPADADSDSPFGDAPRLADATLDTMRGGFSGADGSLLRFAVNLQTVVDGQPIASLTIANDSQGRIFASAQNLGSTVALPGDGSVVITNMLTQAGTTTSTAQNGTSFVTVQVAPPVTSGATGSGASPVVVTTTLTPALPAGTPPGALLAATGLLPNGNGVVTLIQNTQSNAVISAVENLNIQLSGVGNAVLRARTAFQSIANAMRFSVHR